MDHCGTVYKCQSCGCVDGPRTTVAQCISVRVVDVSTVHGLLISQ